MWRWIEAERLSELREVTGPTIAFHIRGGDIFDADKAQVSFNQANLPSQKPHALSLSLCVASLAEMGSCILQDLSSGSEYGSNSVARALP